MNQLTEQLKTLRLSHAARALEQQQEQLSTYAELSFEERLSLLLGCECVFRFVRPPVPVSSGQAFRCDPASMI